MKKVFVKRIIMVIAVAAIVSGFGFAINMKVAEAKSQKMEITCPHCHENTTVDVLQDDVTCSHCHENIHIDG